MSDHDNNPNNNPNQRKLDFDILAPITIIGAIVSIIALGIAFSAHQSDGTPSEATKTASTSDPTMVSYDDKDPEKAQITQKPWDASTKPVKAGPKTFELTATEKDIKLGKNIYHMWTFNDTVPGPTLRAVVGDDITIKIKNASDSKYFHSIDYHASRLTLGGGHIQVAPGEEGEFKFKAEYPGVFMYHCATAPVLHHIGMGMYGMLIIQPEEGFGPPMPEYALVQSELYGSIQRIDNAAPREMAFNGIPSQYAENPIKVDADSDIRLFVLNAGPSELSSFHVVGTIFDKVYEDGNPRNVTYGRQALAIPSSGGGVFEMKLVGEGQFPFVTHQFNHAAKGAQGMILAGDGKPGPGGVEDPAAHGHQ